METVIYILNSTYYFAVGFVSVVAVKIFFLR